MSANLAGVNRWWHRRRGMLRAEIAMVRQHVYKAAPPLDCPITCFAGSDDPLIPIETMRPWQAQTTGAFAMHVVSGDHLFLRTQVDLITEVVRDSML